MSIRRRLVAVVLALGLGAGCRQDMHDSPHVEPLEASAFFADGLGSRPLIEGTVARGQLAEDPHLYRGLGPDGKFATTFPVAVTRELVERGQERYQIFCSPCHGSRGDGRGMIVRRGFKQPNSFHDDRLVGMQHGYFFDVISNGFGQMSSYAAQVPVGDRWAITAYIRVLQLSQRFPYDALAPDEVAALDHEPAAGKPDDEH